VEFSRTNFLAVYSKHRRSKRNLPVSDQIFRVRRCSVVRQSIETLSVKAVEEWAGPGRLQAVELCLAMPILLVFFGNLELYLS
jgi:hypothetical protein